jgi:hypothetical protein
VSDRERDGERVKREENWEGGRMESKSRRRAVASKKVRWGEEEER